MRINDLVKTKSFELAIFINLHYFHIPWWYLGGPKALRREADKFLDYVQYIKHEPLLEPLDSGSSDYRRLIIIHFQ